MDLIKSEVELMELFNGFKGVVFGQAPDGPMYEVEALMELMTEGNLIYAHTSGSEVYGCIYYSGCGHINGWRLIL